MIHGLKDITCWWRAFAITTRHEHLNTGTILGTKYIEPKQVMHNILTHPKFKIEFNNQSTKPTKYI